MSSPEASYLVPPRDWKKRQERFELLLAWYGEERARTEIASHTAQPRSVDELLSELLTDDVKGEWGILLQLRDQWQLIAGPHFARFTFPQSLHDGVLTVSVPHSALLLELKPSADLFLKAAEKLIGPGHCREIHLITGSSFAPSAR